MSTPGERRHRAQVARRIGWGFVVAAVVALFPLVYVLAVEVHVVGASATMFTNCGTVLEPVAHDGVEALACGAALAENVAAAWACAAIAGVCAVVGAVLLLRVPRR